LQAAEPYRAPSLAPTIAAAPQKTRRRCPARPPSMRGACHYRRDAALECRPTHWRRRARGSSRTARLQNLHDLGIRQALRSWAAAEGFAARTSGSCPASSNAASTSRTLTKAPWRRSGCLRCSRGIATRRDNRARAAVALVAAGATATADWIGAGGSRSGNTCSGNLQLARAADSTATGARRRGAGNAGLEWRAL
jgi:hypothetical protein